jgi:hypothetical protein
MITLHEGSLVPTKRQEAIAIGVGRLLQIDGGLMNRAMAARLGGIAGSGKRQGSARRVQYQD